MPNHDFEVTERVKNANSRDQIRRAAKEFQLETIREKYCYNFYWLGRPIIQYPQDIVGVQELIWTVKPDLIIETGIARGGSLILSASILTLIELEESLFTKTPFDIMNPKRRVIGIDVDIRKHNKDAVLAHSMANRITMIEGSSVDLSIIEKVAGLSKNYNNIMVFLDSNHSHLHVLKELNAYSGLVTKGSYLVVFDTICEDLPGEFMADRPWGPGDNPKTAVREFLKKHPEFQVDSYMEKKLLVTAAPEGFLKRVN